MDLNIGDNAPDFNAKDQDGNEIKLSDFKGKKVVLYFYPKDNTPGCTAQACNLRDNYEDLQKQGYVVLGVSQDSEKSHKKFIEKQSLPFPLIADEDHTVHKLFGTWGEKKMYGKTYMGTLRTTFVIDADGKIEDIIQKVKTKEHTAQILNS
ncbi:thioredoxin-dependent thiol peroxidase [Marivirga harenae]|uniref:thioredoxin-dependent thiol peroxidase n=1 Tax=Marivirga harenae TaxID=2010992 RepID=UPI0026DF835A|nr:thioredoxin-dependent thiol peroxidase [Marivirga harenae]WKV11858.1 thioredoxin-dependent thiol peroxidase [Marivirga harenae]|tara:strand:+ start:36409 stop:36861 length:453 start_codon:yes stop_codon:yes gene_type:complete